MIYKLKRIKYIQNNTYQLENKRRVPNEKTQPNQRHKNKRIFFEPNQQEERLRTHGTGHKKNCKNNTRKIDFLIIMTLG